MAITDPRAVKFSNEVVRPLSEQLRQLKEDAERAKIRWQDEISSIVPNDPLENLEDGRDAEGVSRLDGSEINDIASDINAFITWYESVAEREARLAKACVRTLRQ
jgi:hypothetical protein